MSFAQNEFNHGVASTRRTETLGEYTGRTFLWMILGLTVTFSTAVFCWVTKIVFLVIHIHLLILLATLVLSFTMSARIERMSVRTAKTIFIGFSVLFGLTMSIYLLAFGVPKVIFAFLATAVYFGVLALYGHFTHADLSGVRPILTSGLVFLIVFSILSIFIPGLSALDKVVSIVGIGVFLAYTAHDTQKIRSYYNYYSGYPDLLEKASVFSALQLYLNFLNLFLYLLRFFNRRRN